MKIMYCVCTESRDGYGTSMGILKKFETYQEAEFFIMSIPEYDANCYYIQKLYFRDLFR